MQLRRLPSSRSILSYRIFSYDLAAAIAAPLLALWIRDSKNFLLFDPEPIFIYVAISACFAMWFFVLFHVAHGLPNYFSFHDTIEIAKASICTVMATTVFTFSLTRLDEVPRSVPALHFVLLFCMLVGSRLLRRAIAQRQDLALAIDIRYEDEQSVIIVGAGRLAWFYIRLLDCFAIGNQRVAAIIDDNERLHGRSLFGHIILGGTKDAGALLDDFFMHGVEIRGFVICESDHDRALELRNRLESLCVARGLRLELLAEKLGVIGSRRKGKLHEPVSSALSNRYFLQTKRLIEGMIATLAILICFPLFLLASTLVLIDMGSPIIFWQRRIGRGGRSIYIYKFRTMRNLVGRNGRLLRDDERRSPIGQFMRATRLDELPQLFSVVKGDMSLVGPRPLLPVDQPAGPSERLAVAPGITGWAQIHGGKLVSVEEKNELDEWYVHNASLRLDMEIVLRTVGIVLMGDRRNEERLAAALARAAKSKAAVHESDDDSIVQEERRYNPIQVGGYSAS